MLSANIAKIPLAAFKNYAAKSVLIKIKASLITVGEKYSALCGLIYRIKNFRPLRLAKRLIAKKRIAVYFNLKLSAAAIFAFIGYAFKRSCVTRCV